MIITGKMLRALVEQHGVCPVGDVEATCIALKLHQSIRRCVAIGNEPIVVGRPIPKAGLKHVDLDVTGGLVLAPGDCVLGKSVAKIHMPAGYFGLIQTKGTLARYFVAVTMNDGQVDPGFRGCLAFEIANFGKWNVRIPAALAVANLYVLKSGSSDAVYSGRYSDVEEPYLPKQ